jgi:drug/metabolite transporter (DMT)-like permease
VLLNAFAQLGLKAATKVTGPLVASDAGVLNRALDLLTVPSLWYALGAYGLSVIVWVVGLSRVPVSQAYPLLSLGYVLNIGLAWWLLGEVPNAQRVLGIAVIVLGVVVVARS